MPKQIYLDYAAATPLDAQVFAAMKPYLTDKFYNPSATYLAAKAVKSDIEKARAKIASVLGARPSEIIFTAGGTEANNLAIAGIMNNFPNGNLVISAVEHESLINPAAMFRLKFARVNKKGLLDIDNLVKTIDDNTVLVSVMYANNEIGTIQPIREVAKTVQSIRESRRKKGINTPLYLHTDACQAAAYLDLQVSRLGVDLMTINGGKIYGPKQSGALFIKTGVKIEPIIRGGGQEKGLRSGTENVASIVGLAEALSLVQARRILESKRLSKLQTAFYDQIKDQIPSAIINGDLKHRLPSNVHITIPGQDNELLMMKLDEQGIICAVGSACSASNEEPSHVLKAIGLSDEQAQSSLRFTMGLSTTASDIKRTVNSLAKLI